MGDEAPDWGQVWLGLQGTSAEDGLFPIIGSVNTLSTATFNPKISIGDYTKDSEDFISSWIISDLSGGINVEDMNEGSDTNRCWTAFADIRKPGKIAHNTRVEQLSKPSGASGTAYSCGQIVNTPYAMFGTKIYGRKESDGTWYSGVNATLTPVGKPVMYASKIFIPCGSSGYMIVSEADSVANPGVPTVTNVTSGIIAYPGSYSASSPDVNPPTAVAFTVFDQKLWALTTGGALCWSFTGADDTWNWPYDEARAWYPRIESGKTPKRIVPFPNPEGTTKIYATTNRDASIYEQSAPPSLQSTPIQTAPHPDNGGAVAVWRSGEDLHIGNGLDIIRYTSAGVVVPLAGLARDDGLPQELWGRFTDLEPETSELLGMVGPIAGGAAGIGYSLKFGTNGSGNTNFANPGQIARDSSGNIYVADTGNDRLKKHQADGTYTSAITSLTGITGVCVDSSGNVYVAYNGRLAKYNSSLVSQYDLPKGSNQLRHIATDGTHVFVSFANADVIAKYLCADGSLVTTLGASGTGDGQFDAPTGLACDGTYLYVVDQGNDRVQKLTLTGTFVSKWGTSGTGDGQFSTPTGIAINPVNGNILVTDTGRDDIQEFTNTGSFVRKFSALGSSDGQVDNPTGIVITADGTGVYVADTGNDRVTKFGYAESGLPGQTYPGLYGWTGVGWYGKWKGSTAGVNPNWLHVTATDRAYRAYWGMDDGYCYTTKLRRYFHNPRRGFIAGEDEFESTMEIVTSKFDAAMLGNWKIASHMVVFMEHASADEYITIEYQTDADGGWNLLGTVNSTTKTYLPFGIDATTGFSSGTRFNWIQFRIRGFSEDSIYKCPLIKSIVFCFIKVPQNSDAFQFVVAFPNETFKNRSGAEIRAALENLVDAKEMIKLRLHEWDGDQREYRGYLTAVSGEDAPSDEAGGSRSVNFIALRASE